MRVNRRFLYWGVFLVAIGGVLVAADLSATDSSTIADAMRLWPLAIVAIGVGLLLRRTRFSLAGGLLAAAVPGLVLGGGFALIPHFDVNCGGGGVASSVARYEGVFDGPARVSIKTGCGSLVVGTAPGNGWQLDAGDATGRAPIIDTSARSLDIDAGSPNGWHFFFDAGGPNGARFTDRNRESWHLTLPTTEIEDLSLVVSAGEGRIGLPGAQIGGLDLTTNAGQTSVDLSGASVGRLSGIVNAGLLSFRLPSGSDFIGSMEVNAGELQVCVPDGLGVRVHHTGVLNGISVAGRHQGGSDWQNANYASAAHRADLNVTVNLGSLEIDPIGGCK